MAGQYNISSKSNASSMSRGNAYAPWHPLWVSHQGINNWTPEHNSTQARIPLSSIAPMPLDEGRHDIPPLPDSDYPVNQHPTQQHNSLWAPPPSRAVSIPAIDEGSATNSLSNIRGIKNKRWRPSDNHWDNHKNTIQRLYILDNQSLEATMKFMEEKHAFLAS